MSQRREIDGGPHDQYNAVSSIGSCHRRNTLVEKTGEIQIKAIVYLIVLYK